MRNTTAPRYAKPFAWLAGTAMLIGCGAYAALTLLDNSQRSASQTQLAASDQGSGRSNKQPITVDVSIEKDERSHIEENPESIDRGPVEQPVANEADADVVPQSDELVVSARDQRLLESQVKSFLADIKTASSRKNGYDLGDLPPDIASRLIESPEFATRLLDHYTSIADGAEKSTLHNLFVDVGAMSGSPMMADLVASKIGSEGESTEPGWYQLLADLGARTPESRGKLFEVLPNLTKTENVSAVIQAIAPEVSTPETRRSVVNELSPYLTHPDPKVRSAAVHTVSNWGTNQQAPVLERALTDPSGDVRHAAAGAALTSNVQSDSIKSNLLQLMNSRDEDMSTRVQAHYALSRYSLEDEEYGQFYEFHKMLSSQPRAGGTTETPNG